MDIFAHALWSWLLFSSFGNIFLIILFGVLPDLIPFSPTTIQIFAKFKFKTFKKWKHPQEMEKQIPKYTHFVYNITHSFVTVIILAIILYIFAKPYAVLMLPWTFHILVDIPTHKKEFFPTRFLYPISDFCIDGISWATSWFMILNYSLIAIGIVIKIFF